MLRYHSITGWASVFLAVVALKAGAFEPQLDDKGFLTFYLDNDLFGGEDRDYTNGARIAWISSGRSVDELNKVSRLINNMHERGLQNALFQKIFGINEGTRLVYNYGVSLTQLMYTPDDYLPYFQPPYQRRYAGWLGLGLSLHLKDETVLNSFELSLGTTGKNAFAQQMQDAIHEIRGIHKFNGWDNQVPGELTFDLSFSQKRQLNLASFHHGMFGIDGVGSWGLRAGTFRTAAQIGSMIRLGYNLPPDFSDPLLSSTANSHRYFDSTKTYSSPWSVFLLFGGGVHAVMHDATLDGPVFRHFDTGIKRRPIVAEAYVGFGIRYRNVEFSYAHVLRTEEYRTQRGSAIFGTVTVRIRY